MTKKDIKEDSALTKEVIMEEILQFRQQKKTLIIASCSAERNPLASYAPFIEGEAGDFFLFLSSLAGHSVNLKRHHEQQSNTSILLIEDEQSARNLFARKRLTYSCNVSIWPREHPKWQEVIDKLQERFGKIIEVLSGLGDFDLYCLTPVEGNYVRGFGQAYELKDAQNPTLTGPK